MGGRGYMPVVDAIAQARASAERALALDDTLSSAHTSIGGVHMSAAAGRTPKPRFVARFAWIRRTRTRTTGSR